MARPKRRGTSGQAKNFITRYESTIVLSHVLDLVADCPQNPSRLVFKGLLLYPSKANMHLLITVRKLQISLPDFRRLCIFKGIYPRQPRSRQKAAKNSTPNTTFYYTKDIQYLLHEPLLNKFREHDALAKKIARALGKGQEKDAARLERSHAPRMTLDHIVKERYPTFFDALRDLDDALSMLFLFANLPSHMNVPPKTIRLCQRLCHEFQHYLIITHTVRKSFLSIKGIYYQATIQGQDILWLVPYDFVQRVTGDVDFRIMGTFVEFYTTLLGFVNYRLYTAAGFVYPPKFNASSDEEGAGLNAFIPQARQLNQSHNQTATNGASKSSVDKEVTARAQAIVDSVSKASAATPGDSTNLGLDHEDEDDAEPHAVDPRAEFQNQSSSADEVQLPTVSSSEMSQRAADLFKPFVFFLSRETPRAPLEFLLKAFGCSRIGWSEVSGAGAFTNDERDERITHQIVDRPPVPVSNGVGEDANAGGATFHERMPGRSYVQPQWVWDCVNACELLRPDLYAPGATLPPHLSPFVKPKAGEYDPTKPLDEISDDDDVFESAEEQKEPEEEHEGFEENNEDDKDENVVGGVASVKRLADLNGTNAVRRDETSGIEAEERGTASKIPAETEQDFVGFSEDSNGSEDDDYERELKAEATGKPAAPSQSREAKQKQLAKAKRKDQRAKEAEQKERQKMMLSRKKRELYERMEFSNAQRNAETDKLRAKRRKIERSKN